MNKVSKSRIVRKTTPANEQAEKDSEFLKLTPAQRLKVHEQLRKKIWGARYNSMKLAGLKVYKRAAYK